MNVEASTSEETKDRFKGNRPASPGRNDHNERPSKTLVEMKSKPYSFRKDKVRKLFKQALKDGLQLPDSKRPAEANKTDDPNYCPYHRIMGHTIEECYVFKDWLERKVKAGEIKLVE